jgi:hypothetical protein
MCRNKRAVTEERLRCSEKQNRVTPLRRFAVRGKRLNAQHQDHAPSSALTGQTARSRGRLSFGSLR